MSRYCAPYIIRYDYAKQSRKKWIRRNTRSETKRRSRIVGGALERKTTHKKAYCNATNECKPILAERMFRSITCKAKWINYRRRIASSDFSFTFALTFASQMPLWNSCCITCSYVNRLISPENPINAFNWKCKYFVFTSYIFSTTTKTPAITWTKKWLKFSTFIVVCW